MVLEKMVDGVKGLWGENGHFSFVFKEFFEFFFFNAVTSCYANGIDR